DRHAEVVVSYKREEVVGTRGLTPNTTTKPFLHGCLTLALTDHPSTQATDRDLQEFPPRESRARGGVGYAVQKLAVGSLSDRAGRDPGRPGWPHRRVPGRMRPRRRDAPSARGHNQCDPWWGSAGKPDGRRQIDPGSGAGGGVRGDGFRSLAAA